jgi:16S rRNA (cytosine1402-N4)-methyltransferase
VGKVDYHEPVLVKEVMRFLAPAPGQFIIDGTVGHGGHSLEILSQLGGKGLLVGIDRDPQMLEAARKRIEAARYPVASYRLVLADFALLPTVLARVFADAHPPALDGLLLDLGPSTPQLLDPARGMSWTSDESLDMRMNPDEPGQTAREIVNSWDEEALARLFRENAGERWAGRVAERIVSARRAGLIRTGKQLGEIVAGAIPRRAWPPRIHPATRVFLALRIEVNGEYAKIESALPVAFEKLGPGGRMVVISFHSGEDRRVKNFMRSACLPEEVPWPLPQKGVQARARPLTRKAVVPDTEERERNPRSRSAKLRAIQKR